MPYLPHIVSFELKNGDSLGFNAIAKKKNAALDKRMDTDYSNH